MTVRSIKIEGSVAVNPANGVVRINGTDVYRGPFGLDAELEAPCTELAVVSFDGEWDKNQYIDIEIVCLSGLFRVGTIWTKNRDEEFGDKPGFQTWILPAGHQRSTNPWSRHAWVPNYPTDNNDGRRLIKINGQPPEWPSTPVEPMPQGTPDNPDWTGWCFDLNPGDRFECNYRVLPVTPPWHETNWEG